MVFNGVVGSVRQLRTVLQSVLFVPFAYAVFFNMIPTFLVAWDNATRLQERFNDNFRGRSNTYDFIVVGGGTAGSVVANRLSELYSVLLIEAGGPANPLSLVPALTLSMMNRRQTDWRYKTVPQSRACLNSVNQECLISGGRALGGSSTLGDLAFLRGHPVDYDGWARITGDRTWSYEQVLPFFRRSEEFIGTSTDAAARGRDGELRVREPDFLGLGLEWVRAGAEMGFPTVDLNGQRGQGFTILQYPLRRGMRQSTDGAFILPIRLSPRLRVLSNTLVTRILFRDMTNMAYGVEYERFGRTELSIARREVIISAGSLGSPKILMLSGVGPRAHLEQMGIPVRSDLPVGRNLIDHLGVPLGPFFFTPNTSSTPTTTSFLQDRDVTPENIISWIIQGRGPMSTSGLQGAGAISSMPARARGESNWPDLLLLLHGQGIHSTFPRSFARAHSLQEDEITTYYSDAVGRDAFHIMVVGARPTSTGSVLLASTNPRDAPVVNPRYLEDGGQADIRILTEGLMAALNLVENTTMFRTVLGARFGTNLLPGCDQIVRSMAYWDCYIRRFSMSQSNPVGTAAMGSVVDSNLKVRGTRGLRVIDASVMPTIVSVPTLASTIMIAEKGADFILREHAANGTSSTITGAITSAVFGRNGLLTRNPIQRFLAQEFDRMNPLPSLFRMPFNRTDFNPFSRFLGIFRIGSQQPQQQNIAGGDILNSIFGTFSRQTTALFTTLLGGATRAQPQNPTTRPRPLFPLGNILQQFRNAGSAGTNGNTNVARSNASNNLFDIIFPVRNSTITLLNPFQDIYRNQQPQQMNRSNNFNIFGQLFQPRRQQNSALTTIRPTLSNLFQGIINTNNSGAVNLFRNNNSSSQTQNLLPNLNPFSFLLGVGQQFQRNQGLVQGILRTGPTPPPEQRFTSLSPQASSSEPIPIVALVSPAPSRPTSIPLPPVSSPTRFRISLGTTSTTTTVTPPIVSSENVPLTSDIGPLSTSTTTPSSTTSITIQPETELPLSIPVPSNSSGEESISITVPIVDIIDAETTTVSSPPTTDQSILVPTLVESAPEIEQPTTQIPITTVIEDPLMFTVNPVSAMNNVNATFTEPENDNVGNDIGDTSNLRAIRVISQEAAKIRKVHEDYPLLWKNPSDLIHYNDNDYSPALPANFQMDHPTTPFYDYDEVANYANNLNNGREYQNVNYDDFPLDQY